MIAGIVTATTVDNTRVLVSSTAPSAGTAPYFIQRRYARSATPGTWANVGPVQTKGAGIAPDNYTVTGLTPGIQYEFWDHVVDSAGSPATADSLHDDATPTASPDFATEVALWDGRLLTDLALAGVLPRLQAIVSFAGVDYNGDFNHDGLVSGLQAMRAWPGEQAPIDYVTEVLQWSRDGYVIPNGGSLPGYYAMSEGLALHVERTGDATSASALSLIRNNAAYVVGGSGAYEGVARELGYALFTHDVSHRIWGLGYSVTDWDTDRVADILDDIITHHAEWCGPSSEWTVKSYLTKPEQYVQCFMMGISCMALAYHRDFIRTAAGGSTDDARILPTVARTMHRIRELWWDTVRDRPAYLIYEGGHTYSPPEADVLAMFCATAFHWLWKETGDPYWKDAGDSAFTACVTDASGAILRAKQYNEVNSRNAFRAIEQRHATAGTEDDFGICSGPMRELGVGRASPPFLFKTVKTGGAATVTWTPSTGVAGDVFTPATLVETGTSAPLTFTLTPTPNSAALRSVTFTNNAGMTNPAAVSYMPTTKVLAQFTGTNGTAIGGTAPAPTNVPADVWTALSGSATIQTNKASGTGALLYVVDAGDPNGLRKGTVVTQTGGEAGFSWCVKDINNRFRITTYAPDGKTYIYKIKAGATTFPAGDGGAGFSSGGTAGVAVTYEIYKLGSTHRIYKNGAFLVQFGDEDFMDEQDFGFEGLAGTANTWDDVQADDGPAYAFTTKASGNADATGQTTWNETGAPTGSDTIYVNPGHVLTLNASRTQTAGITVGPTADLRGSGATRKLTMSNSTLTFEDDGTYGSTISCTGGTFEVQVGAEANTRAKMVIQNQITMTGASSTNHIFFSDGGFAGGGQVYGANAAGTLTNVGNATVPAFSCRLTSAGNTFRLGTAGSVTFDTCGHLTSGVGLADGTEFLVSAKFINSPGTKNTTVFSTAARTTGVRQYDQCSFDKVWSDNVNICGFLATECAFDGSWGMVAHATIPWEDIRDCYCRKSASGFGSHQVSGAINLGGPITRLLCLTDTSDPNTKWFNDVQDTSYDLVLDGWHWDYTTTGDGTGDCLSITGTPAGVRAITAKHFTVSFMPGTLERPGTAISVATGSANQRIKVKHGSWIAGNEAWMTFSETQASAAGTVPEFDSNYCHAPLTPQGLMQYFAHDIAAGGVHTNNVFTSSGIKNNAHYNAKSGLAGRGFNITVTTPPDSSNLDNVNLDPVDPSRNLAAWSASRGGANTFAAGRALLTGDPSLIPTAYAWEQGGWAPRNPVAKNAGLDGVTIGAVEGVWSTGRPGIVSGGMMLGIGIRVGGNM